MRSRSHLSSFSGIDLARPRFCDQLIEASRRDDDDCSAFLAYQMKLKGRRLKFTPIVHHCTNHEALNYVINYRKTFSLDMMKTKMFPSSPDVKKYEKVVFMEIFDIVLRGRKV